MAEVLERTVRMAREEMGSEAAARLAKAGGPLVDTLFSCYRECVAG